MKSFFGRIAKTFAFLFHLDRGTVLSGFCALASQIFFYAYRLFRGSRAACAAFQDRRHPVSVSGIRFEVAAIPGDLGYIHECVIEGVYVSVPSFVPRPGDTCVDIGANIGSCALRWHRDNPTGRILCFEPHPGIYRRLAKNIALNSADRIETFPWALSDHDGPVEMFTDESSMIMRDRPFLRGSGELVQAHTLDYAVEALKISSIDICKIDVEGHEIRVLEGARRSLGRIKRFVIECHSPGLKKAAKDMLEPSFKVVREEGVASGLVFFENVRG